MSKDKMRDVFPIAVSYKEGEQASSVKFSGAAKQTDTAFDSVTKAIGDPWEYSQHTATIGGTYNLSPERLLQANLARMIGPSDYLSPTGPSLNTDGVITATLRTGKNSWNLGFPLVKHGTSNLSPARAVDDSFVPATVVFSDETAAEEVFDSTAGKLKATLEEVVSDGDHHIDYYTGTITSYKVLTTVVTATVTGTFIPAGVPWGSANVIPTWKQLAALCVVVKVGDTATTSEYTCAFPKMLQQARVSLSGMVGGHKKHQQSAPSQTLSDVSYAESIPAFNDIYYTLPYALIEGLSQDAGDQIPEGALYLWDNSASRIIPGVTFYYIDESNLTLITPLDWLDVSSNKYRIITIGASLAETVGYLSSVVRDNKHVGLTEGSTSYGTISYTAPLSHEDLDDLYTGDLTAADLPSDAAVANLSFTKSNYPTNHHPQYMHRYGWMPSDRDDYYPGNSGNAMRGDLVFAGAATGFPTGAGGKAGSYVDDGTFGIMWGGGSTDSVDGNTRLAFEGGWLSGGGGGSDARYPYGQRYYGANADNGTNYGMGALVYAPWQGTPLHLTGAYCGSDYAAYEMSGSVLGFALGGKQIDKKEASYIKLFPAIRDTTTADENPPNWPAKKGQFAETTPLSISPGISDYVAPDAATVKRVAPEQIREFRFRGVAELGHGLDVGAVAEGVKKYLYETATNDSQHTLESSSVPGYSKKFVSPSIVGADWFNVYSNAIFFSDTGDGVSTSFTDIGETWLNANPDDVATDPPTGIYYEPWNSAVGRGFVFRSSSYGGERKDFLTLGSGSVNIDSHGSKITLTGDTGLDLTTAIGKDIDISPGFGGDVLVEATGSGVIDLAGADGIYFWGSGLNSTGTAYLIMVNGKVISGPTIP